MTNTRRDKFLQRISTVGGGTREAIQMLIGGIVMDVRDFVERGIFSEEEMDTVVDFHDRVEEFWRDTLVSNPPIPAKELVKQLRSLREITIGPVQSFQLRVDQALLKAESFAISGKHGKVDL